MNRNAKSPRMPHVLQLRLTDVQRRYLLFMAAQNDQRMADQARAAIDAAIDRTKVSTDDQEDELPDELRGPKVPLRSLLAHLDESGIEEAAQRYA